MAPGCKTNGNIFGMFFGSFIKLWYVVCDYKNRLDEAILISTHNIHFPDEVKNTSLKCNETFVFLSYPKNFLGTQKSS